MSFRAERRVQFSALTHQRPSSANVERIAVHVSSSARSEEKHGTSDIGRSAGATYSEEGRSASESGEEREGELTLGHGFEVSLVRLTNGSWVGVGHLGGEESVSREERITISSCSEEVRPLD